MGGGVEVGVRGGGGGRGGVDREVGVRGGGGGGVELIERWG